jgi:hypothetical protein
MSSMIFVQQVARERCSGNFQDMFVLANRRELLLVWATRPMQSSKEIISILPTLSS